MTNLEWVRAGRTQKELQDFLETSTGDPEKEAIFAYKFLQTFLEQAKYSRLSHKNIRYLLALCRAKAMDEEEKA